MADDDDERKAKSHVKSPKEFKGTGWESFLIELILYIDVQEKDFKTDKKKIVFTLSLMTEGPAKSFADYVRKEALYDPSTGKVRMAPVFSTWDNFVAKASTRFGNPNKQAEADRKLQNLQQGSMTAHEFFQKFDELSTQAGYIGTAHDQFRVNLVKLHANNHLVVEILKMLDIPKDYETWKKQITKIDDQLRAHQSERQAHTQTQPPARHIPANRPPPPRPSPQVTRTTEGAYVGKGQGVVPMEGVSTNELRKKGLCFRCQKPDHIAQNCPDAPRLVREMINHLEPEERYDLANALASLPESAFDSHEGEEIQIRGMEFSDNQDSTTASPPSFHPTEQ